jgi:DNA modification methylase
MSRAQVINADANEGLRQIKDGSVQTCITSPPYWGLRDYGSDDQLGLEPTPEEYTENLVAVFREVRRVLRDDGTLWLNLGDSYIGGGRGGQSAAKRSAGWQPDYALRGYVPTGMKAKDLVGIPWRVAFALQADGWYLRSDIIWHKPNPMPESVTDRPTKAHEYLFLLTKSPRYYYDADAIREEAAVDTSGQTIRYGGSKYGDSDDPHHATKSGNAYEFTGKRNRRTVWTVTTKPFSGAHFAVFPPDLIEPCVLAGSSPTACGECGAPYERDTQREKTWESGSGRSGRKPNGKYGTDHQGDIRLGPTISVETVGWKPTCDHDDDSSSSLVLDPFTGSGTTGIVALRHGRDFVGTELNPEYAQMAEQRIADDAPLLNEVAA